LFEETIKDLQQKEPPRANIQTPIKANLIKNFDLDAKNEILDLLNPPYLLVLLFLLDLSNLPTLLILSIQLDLQGLHVLSIILEQLIFFQFWKISRNNYWTINIPLLWAKSSKPLQI
jgi:hypothetical protein